MVLNLLEQWKAALGSENFVKYYDTMGLRENSLICIDRKTEKSYITDDIYRAAHFYGDGTKTIQIAPLFAGEKHSNRMAVSTKLYSINASSKNVDTAWKLLSTGLRADMQTKHSLKNGLINTAVRGKRANENAPLVNTPLGKATQKAIGEFETVYNSVDYLYDMNKIKEDLFKPLLKYLDDTSTLDAALKTAEHDIWIRLNE